MGNGGSSDVDVPELLEYFYDSDIPKCKKVFKKILLYKNSSDFMISLFFFALSSIFYLFIIIILTWLDQMWRVVYCGYYW